jgi:hypothetical protein
MFLNQLLYFLYVFWKPFDAWRVFCSRPNNKAIVYYKLPKTIDHFSMAYRPYLQTLFRISSAFFEATSDQERHKQVETMYFQIIQLSV